MGRTKTSRVALRLTPEICRTIGDIAKETRRNKSNVFELLLETGVLYCRKTGELIPTYTADTNLEASTSIPVPSETRKALEGLAGDARRNLSDTSRQLLDKAISIYKKTGILIPEQAVVRYS